MKVRFIFAWYDLWVGLFIDRSHKRAYFLPIPTIGILFDWSDRPSKNKTEIPFSHRRSIPPRINPPPPPPPEPTAQ